MADTRKLRLAVELTGEETFKKGLHEIDIGLKNVKAAQANLDSEFGKGDKSLSRLIQQHELLEKKLKLQKQKLEEIRKEHQKVAEAQGEDSEAAQKLAREMQYAQAAANKTQNDISGLNTEIDKATSATQRFKDELAKGENALQKVGKKVSDLGAKLTKTLTLPIAAAAGVCVNSFMQFEDSLANVATIADTTTVSMEELQKQALDVSGATGLAATEIAAGAYQAISAGVDTAESMKFMEAAAKAAKAGMSDVSTVVNGSTSIMNAWNISATEATSVFEKMIIAQNLGKTSLGELSSSIGELTGLAPSLGVSFEEVLSATAALTKNGVGTSQAMNGLKAVFSGILKPTAEASKEAERLGLEFSAAALKSKGLTGFMKDITEKTKGSEDSLAKLFGSVQGLSQVMLLGGAAASDYSTALDAMASSAGALETAFETRTASRTEQMSMALNKLNNEGIKLGESVAPLIDLGANAISKLADIMNSLTPAQQQTLITIAAVLASIGPLTAGIGKLITGIGGIKKAMTAMFAANPFMLILAGVVAVVAAVVNLKKHLDEVETERKLSVAFNDVTVDTTKIDEALKAAEQIEREIKATADAKITLKQTSEEINAQILALFNTTVSQKDIDDKVNGILKPVFDAIDTGYEEQKKALDEALANGTISSAEYTTGLANASAEATTLTTNMTNALAEYTNIITTVASSGEAITPEQKSKLDELREKIDSLITSVQTAKLEFKAGSLNDYIVDWLSNGQEKSKEDQTEIATMIDDTFNPILTKIQEKFTAGKASLDALYAAGVISVTTYNNRMTELSTNTNQAITDITAKKDAYIKYIVGVATSSTTATQTDIANLSALMAAVIAEYEAFEEIDTAAILKELEDLEESILPTPLDQKTIDKKVADWITPIKTSILAQDGVTADALKTAVSLTEEECNAIKQAALDGGDTLENAIKAYEIDEETSKAVATNIQSARDTIVATINSLGLDDTQRANLLTVVQDGGSVETALMSFGIDPTVATATATSINNAWSAICTAISGMSKAPEGLEVSPEAQAQLDKLHSLTTEYTAFVDGLIERGTATDAEIAKLKQLATEIDALGTAYSGIGNNEVVKQLTESGDSLFTEIKEWLTDGWEDTTKQQEEFKTKVDAYYDGVVTTIDTSYTEKKANLDTLLAAGFIDKTKYDEELTALTTKTTEAKTALEEEKTTFVNYMLELAEASKVPATDQIARLEELKNNLTTKITEFGNIDFGEGQSLTDYVTTALTNGSTVISDEDKKEIEKAVNDWIQPVFDSIEENYSKKKAELASSLSNGKISASQYLTELEQLQSDADAAKAALTKEAAEYVSYVDTIGTQSGVALQEQYNRLEVLRQQVLTTAEDILEANNTALMAARASMTMIENNPESATSRDYAAAVKFIGVSKENAEQVAKENYEKILASLQEEYDKAATKAERDEIVIKMKSASEAYSVELDDIEEETNKKIEAIIAAIASKYPKLDAKLQEMQDDIKGAFLSSYDQDIPERDRKEAVEEYKKKVAKWAQYFEAVFPFEYSNYVEDMSAAVGAGMLDQLTSTRMDSETMNRIMGLNLFTDPKGLAEARLYGGEVINGYIGGMTCAYDGIADAALKAAKTANDAYRKEQGIQSPSKVWKGYGSYLMMGLGLGIIGGFGVVEKSIKSISQKLFTAGQQSINGLIQGAQSRRSALIQAYTGLAQAAITATQSRLKIASPSKVFTQIGEYSGEGMIRGLVNKTSAVQKAMVAMVSPNANVQASGQLANASQSTQVDSHRQNSVNITVNYTGAVTGRESRKLAQQLGGYLSQQLSSRGV